MLTVGFDLDLTLADTRRAIAAVYETLAAETGVMIDVAAVTARIGITLEAELAYWFPAEEVPAMAECYRAYFAEVALPRTTPMPGAAVALEAVRARNGRVVVVTGKDGDNAVRTVRTLGLDVDDVVGSLFGAAKGVALRAAGAVAYVGDHLMDVDAARAAGVSSVAVATGPYDAAALRAYGADVVLPDLLAFPECLSRVIGGDRYRVSGRDARH